MFAMVFATCLMSSLASVEDDGTLVEYSECAVRMHSALTYPTSAQCAVDVEQAVQSQVAAGHQTFVFCINLSDLGVR